MNKFTQIVIADDHQLFTDGLSSLLNSTANFRVCGRLKNGRELVSWFTNNIADVALVDLNMPGMDGAEASKQVLQLSPQTRIIILSMYADVSLIAQFQKAGFAGYIKKDCDFNLLVSCIERVSRGEVIFEESLIVEKYQNKEFADDFLNRFKLSEREKEVMSLIRRGFTSKEIADQLFLSSLTVDTHRKNISQKLGIRTSGGLLKFAIENNL